MSRFTSETSVNTRYYSLKRLNIAHRWWGLDGDFVPLFLDGNNLVGIGSSRLVEDNSSNDGTGIVSFNLETGAMKCISPQNVAPSLLLSNGADPSYFSCGNPCP
jgi:hypothetical protein